MFIQNLVIVSKQPSITKLYVQIVLYKIENHEYLSILMHFFLYIVNLNLVLLKVGISQKVFAISPPPQKTNQITDPQRFNLKCNVAKVKPWGSKI